MSKPIKNIQDLTTSLVENYTQLCNGEVDNTHAKEMSNMAGKIIQSSRLNLEYNIKMKNNRTIPFLETK